MDESVNMQTTIKHYCRRCFLSIIVLTFSVIGATSLSAQQTLPASTDDSGTSISITPNHVYQQAQRIVGEVQIIREAMNANEPARIPGVQTDKRPIHVYAKSLEVLEKIARTQSVLGLPPVTVGSIPLRKVTPQEVYESTLQIIDQLEQVKSRLNITQQAPTPSLQSGLTPSDVYEKIWLASNLMDAVAGQVSPNLVYRNTQYVLAEIDQVAARMNILLKQQAPAPLAGVGPKRVNLEGFMNLHRLANLERKLGVTPLRVANFPSGNITPADVFDTTNTMLAELARIKHFLGIEQSYKPIAPPTGKKPPDVHANMRLIATSLQQLIEQGTRS